MTNLDRYAAAALPVLPRVLGRKLQPFTVGHALLLHRLESPLVTYSSAVEWGDLILAVELLSRSPADAEKSLSGFWLRFCLGTLWPFRLLYWRNKWQLEIATLNAFIDASMEFPKLWEKKSAGTESASAGAPFVLQLLVAQMSWLNKSEAEAMATPFGTAIWQVYTAGEMNGRLQIVSDKEAAIMEALGG